ncbi:protein BTG4 isoform X2 [Narcine bancroftii]|uniref:protein BTG4 isoform X2 n=1 Tax=Narcine bancroftii TaxID=1343680 RepID=UPI00383220C5
MKEEIAATVVFITQLVKKNEKFSKKIMEKFGNKLTKILFEKYKNHWYWGNPHKGQAYRCGEKNQPFIVTKLEEQNSIMEIFKQISNAAERVTSDYFSGMSSDEEGCNKERNTICAMHNTNGNEESFTAALERQTIPIVSNPNSIYKLEGIPGVPQNIPTVINPKSIYQYDYHTHPSAGWPRFIRRKPFVEDCNGCYPAQKIYKMYSVSNMLMVPHVDRYHWVNTKR